MTWFTVSAFGISKYSILPFMLLVLLASSIYAREPEDYACPLSDKPTVRSKDSLASTGGRFDSLRIGGYRHGALDLNSSQGAPVYAVRDGVAAVARENWDAIGNTIVIDHGGGEYSIYGHLDSISVKEGERVSRGAVIGSVGYTGNAKKLKAKKLPPHLHFALARAWKAGLADKGSPLREGKKWEDFWLLLSAKVKNAVDPDLVMGMDRCWSGSR